jgi:hypothetical protein
MPSSRFRTVRAPIFALDLLGLLPLDTFPRNSGDLSGRVTHDLVSRESGVHHIG